MLCYFDLEYIRTPGAAEVGSVEAPVNVADLRDKVRGTAAGPASRGRAWGSPIGTG